MLFDLLLYANTWNYLTNTINFHHLLSIIVKKRL